MADVGAVAAHYSSGTIWNRLVEALVDDGVDPGSPTVTELAPYDHFHGRGLEGTVGLADGVQIAASDHILDVGSGLGGPARFLADRFDCRVTGIDLTAEFCEVAERLCALTGLDDRVSVHHGSALGMPFDDGTFDGAYSMNMSMNIADRDALYREIHRVLRPGGWLVLSELAQGPNTAELDFPVPWARTADESFLTTPEETCQLLEGCGFTVAQCTDRTEASGEYRARARALVEHGHKPPSRAVGLVHPDLAATAAANGSAGIEARQLIPIEIHCTRDG
jgi:ubiquinone/menaquinone biosynthesis C-methylase UbiE